MLINFLEILFNDEDTFYCVTRLNCQLSLFVFLELSTLHFTAYLYFALIYPVFIFYRVLKVSFWVLVQN